MNAFLARIFVFTFFNNFVLIYPLYAVMFTDHGLSVAQVATIMAVWSGTVFALEIPSGVLADKFSRRHIMAVGQITRAVGYACWLFFPGFWGYLAGFLLWGIKSALTHGTFEAYLYDELKALGQADAYAKVYSRVKALSYAAILVASAGASAAILLGYNFVLAASILSGLAAAVVAMSLPAAPHTEGKSGEESVPYLTLLKQGLQNAASDPVVLRLILFMSLVTGLLGTLDEFWPIFADLAGAPKWGIPLFVGAMSGVQGLAAFHAHRLEGWHNRTFYLCVILAGGLLVTAAAALSLWALGLLMVISALDAVVKVVFDARLQHRIGSQTRATVSSVKGLATEVFALFSLGTFGLVSASFGTQVSFQVMGLLIGLGGAAYYIRSRFAHS